MAIDLGDQGNGFRHNDVIRFINSEVYNNGGGPDFYLALRSRPWNEVEDRLQAILTNPQMPRSLKRASTWSALALSVRLGAQQREQQMRRIGRLQEQMEQRQTASWALSSELQQLRDEHEEVNKQLHSTQAALKQTLKECDILHERLIQAQSSIQDDPLPQDAASGDHAEQQGAAAWPRNEENQGEVMAMGTQMAAPASLLYVPTQPACWTQHMQPHLAMPMAMPMQMPMPQPHPFQHHALFPVGYPYSTPVPLATVGAAAAVPLQMPPAGLHSVAQWGAVGSQKMAPLWDQSSYSQEQGLGNPQGTASLEDNKCHNREETPEKCQGATPVEDGKNLNQENAPMGDTKSHSQEEEDPEKPQGMDSLGDSKIPNKQDNSEQPQGKTPMGDSKSPSQEEDPKEPQCTGPLGDNKIPSQKGASKMPQATASIKESQSLSQEEDEEKPQRMDPLGGPTIPSQKDNLEKPGEVASRGDSHSCDVRGSPKKQKPQGQKAKPPNGKKASESQQWEKPARGSSTAIWKCQSCGGKNFSWRMACYKCKEVYRTDDSRDLDPGQAPH
ncbi:PREDICTED: uncharacterized protein LOC102822696 [Chrysochloris asiatica]|uniref:Uncharacterized protein LOC102822696 n=1 Tax=Chrysochloris asiatica TaxID=185453 RepID=A0A9B0WPY3_CHRAS|nr:PREDICTED: uncharacterized protein LOC102822696 [Chrysochloris asiatica]